jgi:hypothetical protein
MIENLTIRKAGLKDIDFILEAIVESEKSSSDIISTCKVFDLSEDEFKEIVGRILLEDIPYYDYYLSGFTIAEKDGEYVGAIGSWLEGGDGTSSGIMKTTMLLPYLDKEKIKKMSSNSSLIKGLTINREPGTLQLEYDYTRSAFRRQGVLTRLIKESIFSNKQSQVKFEKVQVALFKANIKSLDAHLKLGFEVIEKKHVDDPEIFKFFPFNTKVLLELNKDKVSKLLSN